MALLQVKLPGKLFLSRLNDGDDSRSKMTSDLIEHIFYAKYPKLRQIKLSNFKSLQQAADLQRINIGKAFQLLARGRTMFGIQIKDFILIHPDGIVTGQHRAGKRVVKAAYELDRLLRQDES